MFTFIPPALAIPVGLLFLWAGAELLVRGASRIAETLGVSRLLIGLTLVAFGTSLPELLVSLLAAMRSEPWYAVGNVVGSNIGNIGLILGIAALLAPIAVRHQVTRREIPWMLGGSLLVGLLCLDGTMSRLDGLIALVCFGVQLGLLLRHSQLPAEEVSQAGTRLRVSATAGNLGLTAAGLALLMVGAPLLLDGATRVAVALGVSELVIGLTLVAIGTSLPELATSTVAALRGQSDIALGNIVGSNIFNILLILGLTSSIIPIAIDPAVIRRDYPVMLGFSLLLLPICRTGFRVSRVEGLVFLLLYVAYAAWLFLI